MAIKYGDFGDIYCFIQLQLCGVGDKGKSTGTGKTRIPTYINVGQILCMTNRVGVIGRSYK